MLTLITVDWAPRDAATYLEPSKINCFSILQEEAAKTITLLCKPLCSFWLINMKI